jgi:hypothetical protein
MWSLTQSANSEPADMRIHTFMAPFLWPRVGGTVQKGGAAGMPDEKRVFWTPQYATTTSVSTSGASYGITALIRVDPGEVVPLNDEDFNTLLNKSNEANKLFEAAKDAFQKTYGVKWDPKIEFTSQNAIEDSKKLIELRDVATRLFAKVLATPRK